VKTDHEKVQPELLRIREVAALLGIGRTKAWQLVATGEIPAVRLGRCVRIPRKALERWIEARVVEGQR